MDSFEVFRAGQGDCVTRLRKAGYALRSLKEDEITTEESFKEVIERHDCVKMDDLRRELKKIYKNRISSEDLKHFLRLGETKLKDEQLADSMRIIPLDEDGSITVDSLVEFLYK